MQEPSQEELSRPFYENEINLSEPDPFESESEKTKNKPKKDHFWRTISIFVFFVALLRLFVIDPFLVHGSSMEPTFKEGNYVIVDKLTYKMREPKRGDVIIFDAPTNDNRYFIKRVIGLPGERIVVDGSTVQIFNSQFPDGFIINEPYVTYESARISDITLRPDEYFVMGDNREASSDSRIWGPLKKEAITGRALIRLLPIDSVSIFPGNIEHFPESIYPEDIKVPDPSENSDNSGNTGQNMNNRSETSPSSPINSENINLEVQSKI